MNKLIKTLAASAALALSLSGQTFADVDMFLNIDGINGDAQNAQHTNEVVVLAWSWGVSNSTTTHTGSNNVSGSGKANFQDLSITKYSDIASAKLYEHAATGDRISEATLTVRTVGPDPWVATTLKLENIVVTSVSIGGSGGEDRLTENVTLNFSKFTITNNKIDEESGELQKGDPFIWDIVKNEAP